MKRHLLWAAQLFLAGALYFAGIVALFTWPSMTNVCLGCLASSLAAFLWFRTLAFAPSSNWVARLNPDVFLLAAERIHWKHTHGQWNDVLECGNFYACVAVGDAAGFLHEDILLHRAYLEALLRPEDWRERELTLVGWYGANEEWESRVLGLLLCAELASEGFVPPGFEKGGAK